MEDKKKELKLELIKKYSTDTPSLEEIVDFVFLKGQKAFDEGILSEVMNTRDKEEIDQIIKGIEQKAVELARPEIENEVFDKVKDFLSCQTSSELIDGKWVKLGYTIENIVDLISELEKGNEEI